MAKSNAVGAGLTATKANMTFDCNVVYCKWIFKHNPGTDGQI